MRPPPQAQAAARCLGVAVEAAGEGWEAAGEAWAWAEAEVVGVVEAWVEAASVLGEARVWGRVVVGVAADVAAAARGGGAAWKWCACPTARPPPILQHWQALVDSATAQPKAEQRNAHAANKPASATASARHTAPSRALISAALADISAA